VRTVIQILSFIYVIITKFTGWLFIYFINLIIAQKKEHVKKEQHVLSTIVQMLDVIKSFDFNFFCCII
jgi:hypothetical protein